MVRYYRFWEIKSRQIGQIISTKLPYYPPKVIDQFSEEVVYEPHFQPNPPSFFFLQMLTLFITTRSVVFS